MLRIATRESPLALWQAEHVRARLQAAHPGLDVQLVPMTTRGDQILDTALSKAGGKGLFVKELEQAMLENRADLAVHSMKDVPAQQPEGLELVAFLVGEDPRDAFVSNHYQRLDALPPGAQVGTSSLRRQTQLATRRPDLKIGLLRGNVGTRLRRLDEGRFDAILLACAGLRRLGLGDRIRESLDVEQFIPAVGQGVIGIEARCGDTRTSDLLSVLHDRVSHIRLRAERSLNARLGGSCQVPVAGHAVVDGERLSMQALIGSPDGRHSVRDRIEGACDDAEQLGVQLAERLLAQGGRQILLGLGIAV